jgi:thiol-disulfide isomerase/thioredoxin
MYARASVFTALALLLALPLAATAQAGGEGGVSLPLGTDAPGAALEDLEGNAVDLAAYVPRGKPAIIEFWATWCELCEALQPQLDRIQSSYGEQVNIVAVAVGVAQTVRRVRRHLEDHDPGYPYLFDARGAAVRAFNATTTSIVVMLDAQGKVAYTGVGAQQNLTGAATGGGPGAQRARGPLACRFGLTPDAATAPPAPGSPGRRSRRAHRTPSDRSG